MDEPWRMPVLCVAIFLPELAVSAFGDAPIRGKDRPSLREASAHFATAVSQAVVLVLTLHAGWWAPREVIVWIPASLITGLVASYVVQVAYARWQATFSVATPQRAAAYLRSVAAAWPRRNVARTLIAVRTFITSTTEEVVRCVFAFGPSGDHLTLGGLVFAVGFNVAIHWYQGRRNAVFHALWALLAIGVMVKVGLLAAIVAHVAYNLGLVTERRSMQYVKQLRAYERAKRAAERSQSEQAPAE